MSKKSYKLSGSYLFFIIYLFFNQALAENFPAAEPYNLQQFAPPVTTTQYSIYLVALILIPLFIIIAIITIYVIRHYLFALSRVFGHQHNLYAEIIIGNWPSVTILLPAHNEQEVIGDLLSALLTVDYPRELMQIIAIDDRSTDNTGKIMDDFAKRYPDIFMTFHRKKGISGKAAALKDAVEFIKNDVVLVFDADNVPGKFLIKQLVSPFFDAEVGAVMGRAVPGNTGENLLTRLLDMERRGGYQVNQQARENLHAVPQYGGTAGGVRTSALYQVGGWRVDSFAEDTEMTFRMLCEGWITVYQNNAECVEQVPATWANRKNQIKRWTKGHNQVLYRYFFKVLFNNDLNSFARYDGLLLLCTFIVSPLLLLGWILFIIAYYLDIVPGASEILGFFLIISYSGIGNFSIFYEISSAIHLDNLRGKQGNRIRLLPFNYFNFFVSMIVLSEAFIGQILIDPFKKEKVWIRTEHPRRK